MFAYKYPEDTHARHYAVARHFNKAERLHSDFTAMTWMLIVAHCSLPKPPRQDYNPDDRYATRYADDPRADKSSAPNRGIKAMVWTSENSAADLHVEDLESKNSWLFETFKQIPYIYEAEMGEKSSDGVGYVVYNDEPCLYNKHSNYYNTTYCGEAGDMPVHDFA